MHTLDQAYNTLRADTYDLPDTKELRDLFAGGWLRKKLDRARRIEEHYAYIANYCPTLEMMEPGVVIDLGPGDGLFLEFAREFEHEVFGIDAANGAGGMGDAYLRACELIVEERRLDVEYAGVLNVIRRWKNGEQQVVHGKMADVLTEGGRVAMLNARGSLEQIFSDYMQGPPHHEHHDAARMSWRLNDRLTHKAMRSFMQWTAFQLRKGGFFVCHLNGSTNTVEAESWLDRTARTAGLTWNMRTEGRLHVWEKLNRDSDQMGSLNVHVCGR